MVGSRGSSLSKIKSRYLAVHPNDGKSTATEIPCLGVDHCQSQCRRHRCVHGVAAGTENLQTGLRGGRRGAGHGPTRAPGRIGTRSHRRERDGDEKEDHSTTTTNR